MPRYQGCKLRKGRCSETGRAYLVTTVTHARRPVFHDWIVARLLIAELQQANASGLVESLAWVIMPDHLHWLFMLQDTTLAAVVRRVKSRSAISINKHGGHHGRFWQRGFHDRAIRRDEDLRSVARYIIANPLRAGMVENMGDYCLWDAAWL